MAKYNQLELRLRHQTWRADPTVGTNIDILVDGEPIADYGKFATDLPFGLLPSIDFDGVFSPITCTCGEPGCAGISTPVAITHDSNQISWKIEEPPPSRALTFDFDQYRSEINRLVEEGVQLARSGQLADAVPYTNQNFFAQTPRFKEWMQLVYQNNLKQGWWKKPRDREQGRN